MENEVIEITQVQGSQWYKSESGNTYICPTGALDGIENPTDEQLSRLCVNESNNPHNA